MNGEIRLVEDVSSVTAFGVRFWDEVSAKPICDDGLVVTAYPPDLPARRVRAFSNRLGVYVLRNLPGLRDAEFGIGDFKYWSQVSRRPFVIEVVDRDRRFQPFSFDVHLPFRDLFVWDSPLGGSPTGTSEGVPLYSAPGRIVGGPVAIMRAEIWDPIAQAPAAWALIEAEVEGQSPARGVADEAGRLIIIFPYPEPLTDLGTPAPSTRSLVQQRWPVQLRAAYEPAPRVPPIPDLVQTLTQASATLWANSARTQVLAEATLAFGRDLNVQSTDSINSAPLSVLLITPAGSPP